MDHNFNSEFGPPSGEPSWAPPSQEAQPQPQPIKPAVHGKAIAIVGFVLAVIAFVFAVSGLTFILGLRMMSAEEFLAALGVTGTANTTDPEFAALVISLSKLLCSVVGLIASAVAIILLSLSWVAVKKNKREGAKAKYIVVLASIASALVAIALIGSILVFVL